MNSCINLYKQQKPCRNARTFKIKLNTEFTQNKNKENGFCSVFAKQPRN